MCNSPTSPDLSSEAVFCPGQLQSLLHVTAVRICGTLMSSCTNLIMLVSLLKGHQHQIVNSCWLGCIPPASHTEHFVILSATVPSYTLRHVPVIPKRVEYAESPTCVIHAATHRHTLSKNTLSGKPCHQRVCLSIVFCTMTSKVALYHLVSTSLAVDLLKPLCRPGSCTPRACALTPLHTSRTRYTTC